MSFEHCEDTVQLPLQTLDIRSYRLKEQLVELGEVHPVLF